MSRVLRIRTCVGCGKKDHQAVLRRLQLDAAGVLAPVNRPGPGRSAYAHFTPQCIGGLLKTRLLRRSLGRDVDRAARQHAIELFGFATATGTLAEQNRRP